MSHPEEWGERQRDGERKRERYRVKETYTCKYGMIEKIDKRVRDKIGE